MQDKKTQKFLSSQKITWKQLEEYVKNVLPKTNYIYGLTKAALIKYTEIVAKEHPNLTISSISPGLISTRMTMGISGGLPPE